MTHDRKETNILIVDDEPANIKVLMSVLTEEGYEVRVALGGRLAISSTRKRVPDLILLDVRMQDMDGFEVCQRLKADKRVASVPIIFISALGETQDIVQGLRLGGADFITKPFRMDEVLARVETHLSIQALQRRLKKSNEQLQTEIEERRKVENNLQHLNAQLEQRVAERTTRLHNQTIDLMKAKEAAEAATIAKSKFLSNLSHELRTPLNPILGYAQILKTNKNLTDEQKEQLQIICDSGMHLTSLISDMLELVRIDTHPEVVECRAFNLPELLQGLIRDAQKKAQKKNIDVRYEHTGTIPEIVCGDGHMLHHALLHLLDNAVKFTDTGNVTLRLCASQIPQSEGKQAFRFEVRDTGVGIPEHIMDDIFNPFFQGEMEGRLIDGTGLGLTLCHRLVDLMGGSISVQSPYPKERKIEGHAPGSLFTVEIDFETEQGDTPGAALSHDGILSDPIHQKRVLIVDDNVHNLNLLVHALASLGFDITRADSGKEALKSACQKTPDLILLDFFMPGMDGDEVLAKIRGNVDMTKVKVIGVSAAADNDQRVKAFTAACDDYLEKPISIRKLLEKIEQQLGAE